MCLISDTLLKIFRFCLFKLIKCVHMNTPIAANVSVNREIPRLLARKGLAPPSPPPPPAQEIKGCLDEQKDLE